MSKKLIQLLSTFSKKEWIECRKHIIAQYEVGSCQAELYHFLSNSRHRLNDRSIERAQNFIIHAPKTNRSLKTVKNSLYSLTKEVENFLVYDDLKENRGGLDYQVRLARLFSQRQLRDYHSVLCKKIENLIGSHNSFWDDFYLLGHYHHHYFFNIPKTNKQKKILLMRIITLFDKRTQKLSLLYNTEMKNRERLRKEDWSSMFLDIHISDNSDPIIMLLDNLYTMNSDPGDIGQINYLVKSYFDINEQLPQEIRQFILLHLINLAMHFVKEGHSAFGQKLLELYQFGLEKGILLYDNKLSESSFLNIVDIFSKLSDRTQTEQIITKWFSSVDSIYQKEISKLGVAYLNFSEKKYLEVIEAKLPTPATNINFCLRVRWLELCSTYEVYGNEDRTLEKIEALNNFLHYRRKILSKEIILGSRNLITAIKLLMYEPDPKKFKDFVDSTEHIIFKWWLDQKKSAPN